MKLIKSYNFWVSLSGAVGILAVSIAKIFGYEIEADGVSEIIMSICGVLIVFGIVSKPKIDQQDIKTKQEDKEQKTEQNTVQSIEHNMEQYK